MYSSIYRELFRRNKFLNEKNERSMPKVQKPTTSDYEEYVDRTPDDDGDSDT